MKLKVLLFAFIFVAGFLVLPQEAFATKASLSCTPSSGTFNVGDTFTVQFNLDTRTFPVYGADLNMTYDASVIQASGSASSPITTVTNWSAPTTNTVDTSLGKIHMDYGNSQPAYTGNTSIGQITFKAIQPGQAQFQYVFFQQYDDTTPGVAKVWGKKDGVNLSNILTDVTNCIYVVSGPVTNTPGPTSPGGTTPLPTVSVLPNTGTVETTVTLLLFGMIIMTIGAAIPAIGFRR